MFLVLKVDLKPIAAPSTENLTPLSAFEKSLESTPTNHCWSDADLTNTSTVV
jgi:hypothetical protein